MSLNDAKLYHGNYVLKQESVNVGTTPLRAEGSEVRRQLQLGFKGLPWHMSTSEDKSCLVWLDAKDFGYVCILGRGTN